MIMCTLDTVFLGAQTIAVVVAGIYAWKAYKQTRIISDQQSRQTAEIHNEQQQMAEKQLLQNELWQKQQLQLVERQAYLEIVSHTKELREIDLSSPNIQDDAVALANGLEVIAIAWKLKIFDRMVLFKIYGEMFVANYNQIRIAEQSARITPVLQNFEYVAEVYADWSRHIES